MVESARSFAHAGGGGSNHTVLPGQSTAVGYHAGNTPDGGPDFELDSFFRSVDGGASRCAHDEARTASEMIISPSMGNVVTSVRQIDGLTTHLEGM